MGTGIVVLPESVFLTSFLIALGAIRGVGAHVRSDGNFAEVIHGSILWLRRRSQEEELPRCHGLSQGDWLGFCRQSHHWYEYLPSHFRR
jgi:hypothetical protein